LVTTVNPATLPNALPWAAARMPWANREFAIENVVAPQQQSRGARFGNAAIAEDLRFNVQAVELVARNGNCMITRGQAELASYRWNTVRCENCCR
jgi:hypothetical protein